MEDWHPVVKHLSVKQNENIGMQGMQELFFCVNNKSLEEGGIGGFWTPQYRKKIRKIPQYRKKSRQIPQHLNTESILDVTLKSVLCTWR